jgi:hypothetical protein
MEVTMRNLSLLLSAALLGSCAVTTPEPVQPAASARTVAWLLNGKVPLAPQNCLSSYNANDMTVIDSQTIAFREGGYRTSVVHLGPGCGALANGGILVTKSSIGGSLCRGDIAQVLESGARMMIGSCTIGEVVPYVTPRQ